MTGRPKFPLQRRNCLNFVNIGFDDLSLCHPETTARRPMCASATELGHYAAKSWPTESRINGYSIQQNFSSECNSSIRTAQPYRLNDYPLRCHSVPVKSIRNHSGAGSVSTYRPNSSHQYLTAVDLKDSTVKEANVHLGKPTRTSLLRTRLGRKSSPNTAHPRSLSERNDVATSLQMPNHGSVSNMLSLLASKDSRSLHGFITGGRYSRSNFVELLGPTNHVDHICRTSSSTSPTTRLGSRYGSSQQAVPPTSSPTSTPVVPVDFFVEDDSASNCSVDSFALLPDLRTCEQEDVNGPNSRAGRARSALRRHHSSGSDSTRKIPLSVSRINLAFQCSNLVESNNKSSDRLPVYPLQTAMCNKSRTLKSSYPSQRRRVAWTDEARASADEDETSRSVIPTLIIQDSDTEELLIPDNCSKELKPVDDFETDETCDPVSSTGADLCDRTDHDMVSVTDERFFLSPNAI